MMSVFSQWLVYFASYGVAYVCLIIEIIICGVLNNNSTNNIFDKVWFAIAGNKAMIIILIILLAFSIIIMLSITKWKNNTRIYIKAEKNETINGLWMFSSYILPILVCGYNLYIGFVLLILLLLVGFAVVRGGYIHFSLAFIILGYKIYSSDKMIMVTKYKMERYNLLIDENENGIEARRISKNVFIILDH